MKNLNKIMQEIISITSEMETANPELYKYLDETPLHISNSPERSITSKDLEDYLNTLKEQLRDYLKTHNGKN